MDLEGTSEGVSPEPGTRECRIWVQRLQPRYLASAMAYEGSWSGHLSGVEGYLQQGYEIASHTFTLLEDGSGVVTCLLVK